MLSSSFSEESSLAPSLSVASEFGSSAASSKHSSSSSNPESEVASLFVFASSVCLGPRRIGFYRNRISTGNQNHHSVSGSPEPDFLKIRFRSGRTGFQNLTGFRPDFIIWLDYYRISKFSRIPTGIQKF